MSNVITERVKERIVLGEVTYTYNRGFFRSARQQGKTIKGNPLVCTAYSENAGVRFNTVYYGLAEAKAKEVFPKYAIPELLRMAEKMRQNRISA